MSGAQCFRIPRLGLEAFPSEDDHRVFLGLSGRPPRTRRVVRIGNQYNYPLSLPSSSSHPFLSLPLLIHCSRHRSVTPSIRSRAQSILVAFRSHLFRSTSLPLSSSLLIVERFLLSLFLYSSDSPILLALFHSSFRYRSSLALRPPQGNPHAISTSYFGVTLGVGDGSGRNRRVGGSGSQARV